MTERTLVILDLPDQQKVDEVLDILGDDGVAIPQDQMADLDPRQTAAVQALLMGFDMPVDLVRAAHNMLLASFINPGSIMGNMGEDHRKQSLERARALIDEMLGEIE